VETPLQQSRTQDEPNSTLSASFRAELAVDSAHTSTVLFLSNTTAELMALLIELRAANAASVSQIEVAD